jgi:hypothetical protein
MRHSTTGNSTAAFSALDPVSCRTASGHSVFRDDPPSDIRESSGALLRQPQANERFWHFGEEEPQTEKPATRVKRTRLLARKLRSSMWKRPKCIRDYAGPLFTLRRAFVSRYFRPDFGPGHEGKKFRYRHRNAPGSLFIQIVSVNSCAPRPPVSIPYSHSIILSDGNALIWRGKFLCARRRTVSAIRHKFALLISKENFVESDSARFQELSTSIGRFSTSPALARHPQIGQKYRQRVRCRLFSDAWKPPPIHICGIFSNFGRAGYIWSRAHPPLAQTTIWGLYRLGSSRY